jgi:hypothetical protein
VKVFDLVAARTGLKEPEARSVGHTPVTSQSAPDDHKASYPGRSRSPSASPAARSRVDSAALSWLGDAAPKPPSESTPTP